MSNSTTPISDAVRTLARKVAKRAVASPEEQEATNDTAASLVMLSRCLLRLKYDDAVALVKELDDPERTYLIDKLAERGVFI